MPQITVIVPVYKVEPYLHRCIDSILGQTYPDFELILVDDGSPDKCGAICDEYAEKDNRVMVIHQENGGLSAARNAGLDWMFANSDSRWLTFIDSDDWVHPQYLEILLRAAEEHGVDVSMGLLIKTGTYTESFTPIRVKPELCVSEDIYGEDYGSTVVACGKLISREIYRELRFPVGKLYEDLRTTYRYLFAFSAIALVREGLYFYYQGGTSIMRSEWSPRKLDLIEAQENALYFFRKHGFERAEKGQLESYITQLRNQCWGIERLPMPGEFKKSKRLLQSRLRWALRHYRKYQATPLSEWAGTYNQAYPCTMYLYWTMTALIHRIKTDGFFSAFLRVINKIRNRSNL